MTRRFAGPISPAMAATFQPRLVTHPSGAAKAPTPRDRQLSGAWPVFMGLAGGALCYLLAEASIPSGMTTTAEHDFWLTQRLGFILVPALALWLGWLQRSWIRALIGGGCGLLVGWLCDQLCSSAFQPILLGLPILLGAVVAAFCASQRNDRLPRLAGRFGKALLVGLVLGMAYIVLLGLSEPILWPRSGNVEYTADYIRMMWRAGPLALGLCGAMLLPSLGWVADLARPRTRLRVSASRSLQPGAVRELMQETSQAA